MAPKMVGAVAWAWLLAQTAWAARTNFNASKFNASRRATGDGEAAMEPAFDSEQMELRLCIQNRAAEWPKFFEKMAGKPLHAAEPTETLASLLGERWNVKDKFIIKKSDNGKLHFIKRIGGGETTALVNKLSAIDLKIKDHHKFDYAAAKAICKKGWTGEVRLCVEAAVRRLATCETGPSSPCPPHRDISDAQDIEEWALSLPDLYTAEQRGKLARLKKSIKHLEASGFQGVSKLRQECIAEAGKKHDEFRAHLAQQLDVVTKEEEVCVENEGAFCPEGTAPEEKRRFDQAKGAAWSAGGAAGAKVMSILLGGAIGFLVGGPPGAAAGATFALSPATMPIALAGAAAGGYYGGMGPMACSCFPSECAYNGNTCAMGHVEGMNPSRNPLSAALPEQSFKCAFVENKPGVCALQPCAGIDFQEPLKVHLKPWNATASSEPSVVALFGTVGQRGQELFNCVSTDGQATGALSLATILPDGQSNTAMAREKLLLAAAQRTATSEAD